MIKKIFFTSLTTLLLSPLFAQVNWNKISDFNNANSAIWMSSNDTKNFAITADRWIYYNENNSDQWIPFVNVPQTFNVGSIKASKTTNRVFCLTQGSGIVYTDNYGETWQNNIITSNGGTSGFGAMILAYGIHNNKILASTIGPVTGQIQNKLFLSNNNANTFTQLGTIPFYPIGFYFTNDNTVYSNSSSGVYKTSNLNSNTWQLVGFEGIEITDLEVQANEVYISTKNLPNPGRVYKSNDGGESWNEITGLPENLQITKLAKDWQNNRLFATTTAGVYAYQNNEWTLVSSLNKSHEIITTGDNSVMFSGVRIFGVHKIPNNSLEPQLLNNGLLIEPVYMAISDDNKIYSTSNSSSFLSQYNLNNNSLQVYDLFDNIESTYITAIQKAPDGQCVIGGANYIAKTTQEGTINIIATPENAPLAPYYNQLFPQKMFVGNNNSISMIQHTMQDYVDYSPDYGQTWTILFETISGNTPGFFFIDKICSGLNSHYILGTPNQSGSSGLISYNPNTLTWSSLPSPSQPILNIYIDKQDVLHAVTNTTIYKWSNDNNSWAALPINLGATSSNKIIELAFDSENKLYVLVRSKLEPFAEEGIYIPNEDQEGHLHVQFPTINGVVVPMRAMALNPDDVPIFISDTDENELKGFYYYHKDELFSVTENNKEQLKAYPNPTNGIVTIQALNHHTIKAKIYNLIGQEFNTTIHNGQIDLSEFTTGLYILNFEFENQKHQIKIVKN